METRDILNYLGEVIGTMEKPEGTSETEWEAALACYSQPPYQPTLDEVIKKSLSSAEQFGKSLVEEFKLTNVKAGITQAGKTKTVADYCHWLDHYLSQGSLYAAITQIDIMLADANRPNLGLEPFVTDEILNTYKAKIEDYLS